MFSTCELGFVNVRGEHSRSEGLKENGPEIGIPKPSWWIDIPAEYGIPIPTLCQHFPATLRTSLDDLLWATAFADQIVMIAISVVYQALVRQLLLFLEPAERSMVQTIWPS